MCKSDSDYEEDKKNEQVDLGTLNPLRKKGKKSAHEGSNLFFYIYHEINYAIPLLIAENQIYLVP